MVFFDKERLELLRIEVDVEQVQEIGNLGEAVKKEFFLGTKFEALELVLGE